MSTSGEQARRPLTRRELRELRARGGESAVRDALQEAPDEEPVAPPAQRPEDHVVATSAPEATSAHPPLTRREMRRLRTNEVPVITPAVEAEHGKAEAASEHEPAPEPSDVALSTPVPDARETDVETAEDPAPEDPAPEEQPAAQEPERREPADAEPEPSTTVHEFPTLSPTFGAGVGASQTKPDAASFDELMEQYATTSPSSIIMTSSHRLPEGLGSTGAAKGTTDGREVDAVLIDGELPAASSPTPIAASAAISTQKSAGEVLRPPAPEKGRGMLMALGITAGALGIVAVATLATLYFTGVFNQ